MSDLDNYIDWLEYWDSEISCQIQDIEDYEPEIKNIDYKGVKSFFEYDSTEIQTSECYLDGTDIVILFAMGTDDENCGLWFTIGKDGLIKKIILES